MTNGIGADPSGAYSPISGGWEKTVASGKAKHLPTAVTADCIGSTLVADTGVAVAVVKEKTAATTGYNTTTNDTYDLDAAGFVDAKIVTATSVAIDYLKLVVTVNAGSLGTGTFDLSHAKINSISNVGLITFIGTGFFDDAMECTITYKADVPDSNTFTSAALPVMGVEAVDLYAEATGQAEVAVKWEWTDDEIADGSGSTAPSWTEFYSAQAAEKAVDTYILNDKARFIRLHMTATDAALDGVPDVSAALGHVSDGCYAQWTVTNDASNNLSFADDGITSIGGIGVDPS